MEFLHPTRPIEQNLQLEPIIRQEDHRRGIPTGQQDVTADSGASQYALQQFAAGSNQRDRTI